MRFTDTWLEYLVTGRNPLWTSSSILRCVILSGAIPSGGVMMVDTDWAAGASVYYERSLG